ncbi:MAG: hypothetical protein WB239_03675 [Acidimicrobiia bacterium]
MNVLTLSGVVLSPTGLAYSEPPSWEQWEADGRWLARETEAIRWRVGDWYNAGERYFGEQAAQAVDGLSAQSIQNAAWVANRYIGSRRREGLSWSHHAEVAALEPEEADALLDEAEANQWPVKRLRAVRNEVKAISNGQRTSLPTCPECGEVLVCPNCGELR